MMDDTDFPATVSQNKRPTDCMTSEMFQEERGRKRGRPSSNYLLDLELPI